MKEFAKTEFRAAALSLPVDWTSPAGKAADQYRDAFRPNERAVPIPPVPPGLFIAASPNQYHCDTAREISSKFEAFIDGICSAICSAWSQWQSTASMTGVIINAVTATAGQVVGPPLGPLILAQAPKATPQELKYSNAIANAVDAGWLTYQSSIKVPALPWYPAFAAFPGPVAPPMPNIPCPVVALTQVTASISSSALKASMIGNLGDPLALHHKELFGCIAGAFEKVFMIWQGSTMVTNVLGTGPVPTFAPPFVPVGPVVAGVGNMPPGGFV